MTAYIETLTDANYKGQSVVQTFPLIGNYGIITSDMEGETVSVSGYIVRKPAASRQIFCETDIDTFLKNREYQDQRYRHPCADKGSERTRNDERCHLRFRG